MKPEDKEKKSVDDQVNTGSRQDADEEYAQDLSHEEEQSSWLEASKLDTEFPLSGGETEEDFSGGDEEDEDDSDISSREHLDDNFPLSGG